MLDQNALLQMMQPQNQGNALIDPINLGLMSAGAKIASGGDLSQGIAAFANPIQQAEMAKVAEQKAMREKVAAQALAKQQSDAAAREKIQTMLYKDIYKQAEGVQEAKSAYGSLMESLTSDDALGDVASVIGFMKSLDPRSIVTEGEQQLVNSSQGMFASLAGNINKAIRGGGVLTDKTKAEIARIARGALESRLSNVQELIRPRLEMADRSLIPRPEVAPTFMLENDWMAGVPVFRPQQVQAPDRRQQAPQGRVSDGVADRRGWR